MNDIAFEFRVTGHEPRPWGTGKSEWKWRGEVAAAIRATAEQAGRELPLVVAGSDAPSLGIEIMFLMTSKQFAGADLDNLAKPVLDTFFRAQRVQAPESVGDVSGVLFDFDDSRVVRRRLLHECDVHTLLRLPTGLFYAQGVKANVIFFDRKPGVEKPWTKTVWVYDLRTNQHFTLKTKRMTRADIDDFVECYRPDDRHNRKATWSETNAIGRWRPFTLEEILARDKVSLDLFWLRDESLEDSANLPDPHLLAEEIADDLRSALEQIESVLSELRERASAVHKPGAER